MSWWQRQTGKNTKSRMVSLLRRGSRSVEELAAALGLTNNAVRAQLTALEQEKVVQAAGIRHDGTVGKPATLYGIAPESSALFSSASAPVLAAILAELGRSLTPREVESLLRRAGARLALSVPAKATFDDRVKTATTLLAALGADTELIQTTDGYEIRGHGCVLTEAVVACPATCRVLEQLLRNVTGGDVEERCDRAGPPACRFTIASPAAHTAAARERPRRRRAAP